MSGRHAAIHAVERFPSIDIGEMWPASPTQFEQLLAAPVDGEGEYDGRSAPMWVRFVNGDLALIIWPHGDTYLQFSESPEAEFVYAAATEKQHITLNSDDMVWVMDQVSQKSGE